MVTSTLFATIDNYSDSDDSAPPTPTGGPRPNGSDSGLDPGPGSDSGTGSAPGSDSDDDAPELLSADSDADMPELVEHVARPELALMLPPSSTSFSQPIDVGVNRALRRALDRAHADWLTVGYGTLPLTGHGNLDNVD